MADSAEDAYAIQGRHLAQKYLKKVFGDTPAEQIPLPTPMGTSYLVSRVTPTDNNPVGIIGAGSNLSFPCR